MSDSNSTTDHDTIRKWVEVRGGKPARVRETGQGSEPGILRFDFGEPDQSLERISWDEFFRKFEQNKLALLYEDDAKSRFNKLIRRH